MTATRFTGPQRFLHWLMAICILAMLFIGVGMVSTIKPIHLELIALHEPLGLLILILAIIRLGLRLRDGAPPLPASLPEPMKLAAKLSHYLFYALMIAMPLLGWAMLSAAAFPILLFGTLLLPPIIPADPALHSLLWDAHRYLAFLFFAVILLHFAAALFHAPVRNDGAFAAMAPYTTANRN